MWWRRRRVPADVVQLLADGGFHARRRADGRIFASHHGDQWLIVLATDRKDPYRAFKARDQVALCVAAATSGAEPWLAWWPKDAEVPRWIAIRRWAAMP